MKIQNKPDYLVFADSAKKGENLAFPDVSRGWGITIDQTASKPPMEWMNGAFNRIDRNMLYLLQQGVPEWSELVKYPANAIIKYNGVLYTAIAENDNAKPSTNSTKWKKTQAEIPYASNTQYGIVKLNSATNNFSETEAATPLAVKITYDFAIGVKNIADTATSKADYAQYTADTAKNDAGNAQAMADSAYAVANIANTTANTVKAIAETDATASVKGRVKLNSSIYSTSEIEAATPLAVKKVNDNIERRVSSITPATIGALTKFDADWCYLKQENAPNLIILYPGGTVENPPVIDKWQRIIVQNPFPNCPVFVQPQLWINGVWGDSGHQNEHYSTGTMTGLFVHASQLSDSAWRDIIVQSGNRGVAGKAGLSGAPHTIETSYTSAPYRLLVWRIINVN